MTILIGVITAVFTFRLFKKGEGAVRKAFLFFLSSTIFLALLRQFYFIQGLGISNVSETVLVLWWHFLYYTGIALLIYGIVQLKIGINEQTKLKTTDKFMLYLAAFIFVSVNLSFFTLHDFFTPLLKGTILDYKNGFIHFLAFLLGVYATLAMINFKSQLQEATKINFNLLFFGVFLLYTVHLWELLTESWHILNFADAIVETVEGVLSITGIILFLIAYWICNKKIDIEKQAAGVQHEL